MNSRLVWSTEQVLEKAKNKMLNLEKKVGGRNHGKEIKYIQRVETSAWKPYSSMEGALWETV